MLNHMANYKVVITDGQLLGYKHIRKENATFFFCYF